MTGAAPDGAIRLTVEGAVARITFDRPGSRNAMTWAMYEDLASSCARIAADPGVRVVVLRGAGGRAFVSGTAIDQFRAFTSGEDGVAYERDMERFVGALESLDVPTIAVVEDVAAGGGLILANACDIRIATPGTRFGVPIARTLGNCLSAANLSRLCATLGESVVRRMLLAAELVRAEDLPPGYAEIVAVGDLDAHVDALCTRISGQAPVTMRATKQGLRLLARDARPNSDHVVRLGYGSADFREGVEAFVAKRRPAWTGN